MLISCPHCERTFEAPPCGWCSGTGKVKVPCPADHHDHDITIACGRCQGTGVATGVIRIVEGGPYGKDTDTVPAQLRD